MAKTASMKRKGQSVHSRAAKRASSPSIDTDKSLKEVKPPAESINFRPSILAVHQGAGISKKQRQGRKSVLSSKAKRRLARGLDRAEAVMDKNEKKVEKSKGRARTVQERSKAWDELNRKIVAKRAQEAALALEKENWAEETNKNNNVEFELETAVVDGVKDLEVTDHHLAGASTTTTRSHTGMEDDEVL